MKKEFIEPFFATLKAANPQPNTELEYTSVFELLAAVLLSAQATDVGVNKATRPLFKKIKTPKAMLALGEDKLREAIQTIGLFRTKAKNVIALSEILLRDYGGEVPADRDLLQSLPRRTLRIFRSTQALLARPRCSSVATDR